VDEEEDEAAAESRRAAAASMAARRPSREEGERRGGLAAGYSWCPGGGATPRALVVFVSSSGCGRRGACGSYGGRSGRREPESLTGGPRVTAAGASFRRFEEGSLIYGPG